MQEFHFDWEPSDVVADLCEGDRIRSRKICRLLDDGNSIPFIARYRKGVTGNMMPDQLRDMHDRYESLK